MLGPPRRSRPSSSFRYSKEWKNLLIFIGTAAFILFVLNNIALGSKQSTSSSTQDSLSNQNVIIAPWSIVIGVFSTARPSDRAIRDRLRQTYFRYSNVCHQQRQNDNCTVTLVFVLGQPPSSNQLPSIEAENKIHGDIVLLPDTVENMNDGKTYAWWKYASINFPHASFYAKADTDTYIWTLALEADLRSSRRKNIEHSVYYGRFSCGHMVGCGADKMFVSGGFQVMSRDLVFWIADPLNTFVIERSRGVEDLITGTWLHVGHRFVNLVSPCPSQVEDMYKIYNDETCGDVFMHWLKDDADFLDLYNNRLSQVLERKKNSL